MRGTLTRFAQASADRDYVALCSGFLARDLVARIRSIGVPCEVALRTGLSSVQDPQIEVRKVKVQGLRALAEVRSSAKGQDASVDVVRLVKEAGSWRIASLSGPQPPRPQSGNAPGTSAD